MKALGCCTLVLFGCGDFHFVDGFAGDKAAAAPILLQVVYSENEDLSAMFWQQLKTLPPEVGAYEIGVNGVFSPLSALAQPVVSHNGLLSFGVVVPGRVQFALRLHVQEGFTRFAVPHASSKNLSVDAAFTHDDTTVNVTATDPFASLLGGGIVRTFSAELRDASCAEVLQSGSSAGLITLAAPAVLTDDGNYCVTLASHAASFALPLQTVPLVDEIAFSYSIPTVTSSDILVPVFDFDEPDSGSCAALLTTVQQAIAASGNASVVTPINVAAQGDAGCQPPDSPTFDLGVVQDEVAPFVTSSGGATPAVLFFLASNVDAPIANSLQSALQGAVIWAQEQSALSDVAILGTDNLTGSYLNSVRTSAWTYADDPALPQTIEKLLTDVIPYASYDLEPQTTLSFFSAPLPDNAFGFKLCDSNLLLSIDGDASLPYYPLPATPGTYHATAVQPFVPAYAFAPGAVTGTVEVCSRYCDRDSPSAWSQNPICEGAR